MPDFYLFITENSEVHKSPEERGRSGVTRAQSRGGGVLLFPLGGNKYHDFITILCHVGFSIFKYYRQTNFPIIKDRAFQGHKILKKYGRYLGQSG